MAHISKPAIVACALDLLQKKGLDKLSTRAIARELKIESASLYWHYDDKAQLLTDMAHAITRHLYSFEIPSNAKNWDKWLTAGAHRFRETLLQCRDGARLLASSFPHSENMAPLAPKIAFLQRAGFSRHGALMAMLTISNFVIGNVLESQTRPDGSPKADRLSNAEASKANNITGQLADAVQGATANGFDEVFEFGLKAILEGLRRQL